MFEPLETQPFIETGLRYWPRNADLVNDLPLPKPIPTGGFDVELIELPVWARDLHPPGFNGLLAFRSCVVPGDGAAWERCSWALAALIMLAAVPESLSTVLRPAHSYSTRLRHVDSRLFECAWVNRIMLFLRRWAAREAGRDETELFGPLPEPEFDLTHDVDAIDKTLPIRFKQSAFNMYNVARGIVLKLGDVGRFMFGRGDYWQFDTILGMEEEFGVRSTFHFHAKAPGFRSPRLALMDPSYDVESPRLKALFGRLKDGGWTIGLHPGFDTWNDADAIRAERERLATAADTVITRVRQHWLRFGFAQTWTAQVSAGLDLDSTLGFNDRPGFRASGALRWRAPGGMGVIPLVLMDSHLYDYRVLDPEARRAEIRRWVDEVRAVHGVASFVWHQRVMHSDYGWGEGYRELLEEITR